MGTPVPSPPAIEPASLIVVDSNGRRTRHALDKLPFRIGRQAGNDLLLRDNRISRTHARILAENGEYLVEDCESRHGTYVNGKRITRHTLRNTDKIEFGVPDSYHLVFVLDGVELKRLMNQVNAPEKSVPGVGGNLAKLRAVLDLARTIESSFSVDDVLVQVVHTALAVTGAERGFLLLRSGDGLETRVARQRDGQKLHESDLRVPRAVIQRALNRRGELLYMNFDSLSRQEAGPENSIADLELRSVICLPLVRIGTGLSAAELSESTTTLPNPTTGVLYMDSRRSAADLAGGNREILQTLAIEASMVLENARLLEEERTKHQMEEELELARVIQQSLLPGKLPSTGWLRACGSSIASRRVGGDYFDVTEVGPKCWSAVVADVSGKGVGSALLASLLQGALLTGGGSGALERRMGRLNRFLLERTAGEKYATIFYCLLESDGRLSYVNAAQNPPILLRANGEQVGLDATSVPVGLLEQAVFPVAEQQLAPGDKLIVYTDGVTEAQSTEGKFFGKQRLRSVIAEHAQESCIAIHDAIQEAVTAFTEGAVQSDDITVLVIEFQGAAVV